MIICYMKDKAMTELKVNITANKDRYHLSEPWVETFFKDSSWFLQSNIRVGSDVELVQTEEPDRALRLGKYQAYLYSLQTPYSDSGNGGAPLGSSIPYHLLEIHAVAMAH